MMPPLFLPLSRSTAIFEGPRSNYRSRFAELMPNLIVIRKDHARRFLLAHLHLWPPRKLRGKQGVLDYIRHVNCIQYDPINVVGQNPHLCCNPGCAVTSGRC